MALSRNLVTLPCVFLLIALSSACPPPQDILPCVCSTDPLGAKTLECFGVATELDLSTIFQAEFPEKNYYDFYLADSPNVNNIGDSVFNGVSFEVMEFYMNGIGQFSPSAFIDSMDTLKQLIIKNNPVDTSGIPFQSFESYPNLKVLNIDSSLVSEITPFSSSSLENLIVTTSAIGDLTADVFSGLQSISNINLERNKLSYLLPGTFSGLPLLRSINLSENELTFLEPGTFEFNDATSSVYIWNNNVTNIEPGTFVVPATTDSFTLFLDLGSNNIAVLNEEVFAPLFPYIEFFFVAGNPLRCECDIAWLVTRQDWMGKVGNTAECEDGRRLVDLDPAEYLANC